MISIQKRIQLLAISVAIILLTAGCWKPVAEPIDTADIDSASENVTITGTDSDSAVDTSSDMPDTDSLLSSDNSSDSEYLNMDTIDTADTSGTVDTSDTTDTSGTVDTSDTADTDDTDDEVDTVYESSVTGITVISGGGTVQTSTYKLRLTVGGPVREKTESDNYRVTPGVGSQGN
ncbi:MAG: hypothetical protein JXR76_19390 [Deltaproteobacteria bacterium]|nr:hypothetical protein [Deltaproteobacteria bacterium]